MCKQFEQFEQFELKVNAANNQGIRTTAVLTTMDSPIGMAIGNTLEVLESVQTLRGQGPSDLVELVKVQGSLQFKSTIKAD